MFEVMWSDGYYITKDGEPFIDGFARDVEEKEVWRVRDLLNAAKPLRAGDGVLVSVNERNEITCKVCGRGMGANPPRP